MCSWLVDGMEVISCWYCCWTGLSFYPAEKNDTHMQVNSEMLLVECMLSKVGGSILGTCSSGQTLFLAVTVVLYPSIVGRCAGFVIIRR